MSSTKEVVITGVGVVSPIGIGTDVFWNALMSGQSGVVTRPGFEDTDYPFRICAPVKDFDGRKFVKPRKAMKVMCQPIQFGYAAAKMAFEQAGFEKDGSRVVEVDPDRMGTVFGTETFFADPMEVADVFRKCVVNQEYDHRRWGEFAMREIQPLWMLKYLPNMVASHISIALDARGPSNSICQGDASGLLAIIEGIDLIRRGTADVVVAGGTGSRMALTAMMYRGIERLSQRIDEPEQACRPFDRERDGMVAGEGAGAIVLESKQHAEARGQRVLATVKGYSRTVCPLHDDGFSRMLAESYGAALIESSLETTDIGHFNANGVATRQQDSDEAKAIANVFGETPVAANKGNFGNLGPGTSAIEFAATVLALSEGVVAPNRNLTKPDADCPINVNSAATTCSGKAAFKSAFSMTGQIANLIVS